MGKVLKLTWADVWVRCSDLRKRIHRAYSSSPPEVYGIPRGGSIVAGIAFGPDYTLDTAGPAAVIIDDVIGTGATFKKYTKLYPEKPFVALVDKPVEGISKDTWVVFPWEVADEAAGPEDGVRHFLEMIGEDPTREGLVDTPARYIRALREMTRGMQQDPKVFCQRTFDLGSQEMVIVRGIRFTSLCEHHLLPFFGTAMIAYIPGARCLGLSKPARVVEALASRLQVQERLTAQIADTINDTLSPQGVGVILRAHHTCMGCRGVRQPDAEAITSAMRGALMTDPAARAEMLALCRDNP